MLQPFRYDDLSHVGYLPVWLLAERLPTHLNSVRYSSLLRAVDPDDLRNT